MKITEIEILKAELPLKRPLRIALGETSVAGTLFVRVHTNQGIYGIGEANPFAPIVGETLGTALVAAQEIAKLLIGANPLDIEGLVGQMRAIVHTHPTTRSAFDMALFDIMGKVAGMPLYQLLGGQKRVIESDNTVGIDTPEIMVRRALEFRKRGFQAVKVKLGTTVPGDIARIAAIRDAIGPMVRIRIDANQGWDRTVAITVLRALEKYDVEYCEQPVAAWDIDAMAAVSAASAIPIMADEALFDHHDAMSLIKRNACTYFNIKLAKSSGLFVADKINSIAEAAGIKCMVGCMNETRLGLTAAAHLVSARRNIVFADLDSADMLRDDPVEGGMVYGEKGQISLPDGVGIGADIAPDYLKTLQKVTVTAGVNGAAE